MIISASYKTDIPTFYGSWFMNRLEEGSCMIKNAWNDTESEVSLRPGDVDAFVFWTKNLGPFVDNLDRVADKGFPFIVQYTINGYPRELEMSVVNAERSVEHMHALAARFGMGVGVWRYDPIVMTNLTDFAFHVANFRKLAESLKGSTDEVVVSFVHLYDKTLRNMYAQESNGGFEWESEPELRDKKDLLLKLTAIAEENGMKVTVCSQPEHHVQGVEAARCIDASRIKRVWSTKFTSKTKGNRPGCMCAGSKDIGEYDTCPHGCVYCYAVKNRSLAKGRFKSHDPNGRFLFSPDATPEADT